MQSVIDSFENVVAGIIEQMIWKSGDENENDEEIIQEALEKLIYKVWLGISSDIVSDLASNIPENQNFKLFFDNWLTSISLMNGLRQRGILSVGTILLLL